MFKAFVQRFNAWLLRLTARRIPGLGKILNLADGTVDRLAAEVMLYRQRERDEINEYVSYVSELREAIAVATDSWAGPLRESGGVRRGDTPAVQHLREAVQKATELGTAALRETVYGMAELEIAIEDRGWKRMIAQSQFEFSRFGLQSIILISRLYYLKNPIIRRGVEVSCFYVFGRGMEVSSPDEAANEVIQDFFTDLRNSSQLTHSAFTSHEQTLNTDGNLFWVLFTDERDGQVIVREIDCLEIHDIITDPNDASIPWYYLRQWTECKLDQTTGNVTYETRRAAYVTIDWETIPDFPKLDKIQDHEVFKQDGIPVPILHIKDGSLPKWRFGCSRIYSALDWTKAYREGLENYCTTRKAFSRYAWRVETQGGAPAIAGFKQAMSTTLANNLMQIDTNPPPVTGAAFIAGPTDKIEPIKTNNSTMSPDDLRRVLLMACASLGLGEHFFGDATTGSLATAASLDRPTELMFLERQELWRSAIQRLCHYVLARSLRAPAGKFRAAMISRYGDKFKPENVLMEMTPLKNEHGVVRVKAVEARASKPEKITVDVKFPDILAHDIKARVDAIVSALTLNGFNVLGIDEKTGIGLLLAELGVQDVQAVLDEMYPESEYSMDRTIEPPQPSRITVQADDPEELEQLKQMGDAPKKGKRGMQKESQILARAVLALQKAVQLQEAMQTQVVETRNGRTR